MSACKYYVALLKARPCTVLFNRLQRNTNSAASGWASHAKKIFASAVKGSVQVWPKAEAAQESLSNISVTVNEGFPVPCSASGFRLQSVIQRNPSQILTKRNRSHPNTHAVWLPSNKQQQIKTCYPTHTTRFSRYTSLYNFNERGWPTSRNIERYSLSIAHQTGG